MSKLPAFETYTHAPRYALSLVDRFAQALRLTGAFPPPLCDVSCEIVEATAPVQRKFQPARVLSIVRNRSGYLTLDGTYADADAPDRQRPLAAGTYRVRVRGELYRDATFDLTWPLGPGVRRVPIPKPNDPNADSVELFPSGAYPLPDLTLGRNQLGPTVIRGALFESDATPIEGARIEVLDLPLLTPAGEPALGDWPFLQATSGPNGDWAIVLPGRLYIDATPEIPPPPVPPANAAPLTKRLQLRVTYLDRSSTTYPNNSSVTSREQPVVLGSEHALRNTALRGQVLGPGGRPIEGARITTSVNAMTSTSRGDGSWTLYFALNQDAVPNVSVTATTPAQASATYATASVQADRTVLVPTFQFS